MSTASRIPQNRPSRLVGPSKLPSRILRPTSTNKTQHAIPNFVNSAKHLEKKREAANINSLEGLDVDSNRNIKNPKSLNCHTLSVNRQNKIPNSQNIHVISAIDCNANKKNFASDQQSNAKSPSLTASEFNSKKPVVRNQEVVTSNLHGQHNTVQDPVQDLSERSQLPGEGQGDNKVPSFRSMKPGYFMQKVNAIKNSQQRESGNMRAASVLNKYKQTRQENSSVLTTNHVLYSKTASQNQVTNVKSRFGYKTEDGAASDMDTEDKLSKQGSMLQSPSIRCEMANGSASSSEVTPSTGSYVSRAEKRKKYLEAKNVLKSKQGVEASLSPSVSVKSKNSKEEGIVSFGGNGKPTSQSQPSFAAGRSRPLLRKQNLRSAKIARPVIRPKSNLCLTAPKPFLLKSDQSSTPVATENNQTAELKPTNYPRSPRHSAEDVLPIVENQVRVMRLPSEMRKFDRQSPEKLPEADHHSVASAVSEESGYISVASTNVFLDNHPPSESLLRKQNRRNARPYRSETDIVDGEGHDLDLEKRPYSHSLSDVLSSRANVKVGKEEERQRFSSYLASKDIIMYGQYRLQAEGNYALEHRYGVTESRLIRSSSGSDSDLDLLQARRNSTSPADCENVSDSSADTVIRKSESPKSLVLDERVSENDGTLGKSPTRTSDEALIKDCETSVYLDIPNRNLAIDHELRNGERKFENKQTGDFQFTKTNEKTLFTSATSPLPVTTPQVTPSTNSTSKAKKRKTDSVLMSPLSPDAKVPNEEEDVIVSGNILEKEIIFEDHSEKDDSLNHSLDESYANDENLSGFIDLPSLHESALMADYNSLVEEDLFDAESDEDDSHVNLNDGRLSPNVSTQSERTSSTTSVQTNMINKLLSKGLDGVVRSNEDMPSCSSVPDDEGSNKQLMNGYHYDDEDNIGNGTKRYCSHFSAEARDHHYEMHMDEVIQEYRVMKMSLAELYRILETKEEETERQNEENKRLQLKNQRLAQTVENLTQEMAILKLSKAQSTTTTKQIQVQSISKDAATSTTEENLLEEKAFKEVQECGAQTLESHRWYHSEVSDKVLSNIENAKEEIQFLRNLQGDFDKRIQDTEKRLHSALELMHR